MNIHYLSTLLLIHISFLCCLVPVGYYNGPMSLSATQTASLPEILSCSLFFTQIGGWGSGDSMSFSFHFMGTFLTCYILPTLLIIITPYHLGQTDLVLEI